MDAVTLGPHPIAVIEPKHGRTRPRLRPSAEAPEFQTIYGVLLLLFIGGLSFQLRWLRARGR
jgi:hypothetical protein